MNHPDLQVSISEDTNFIVEMETAVKYSARTPNGQKWKNPAARLAFYEEVRDNVPNLLQYSGRRQKRSVDSGLAYYKANMEETLHKMNKMADDLDVAAKKFGIAQTLEGAVSITAGILGGLGLILAPFTAGASLGFAIPAAVSGGLVIAGTVVGVTAGLHGLVSE